MSDAIEILYEIYFAFVNWVFNSANIIPGVSIGWIAVTVFIFSILIRSLINVARAGQTVRIRKDDN